MIGGLVTGKVIMDDGAASMCIAKISSLRQKSSAKYVTYAPSHCIEELQITGKVLGGSVINDILILKPGNRCEGGGGGGGAQTLDETMVSKFPTVNKPFNMPVYSLAPRFLSHT